MTAEGLPVQRLRTFLRELKPEARALLVAELERRALRGAELPGSSLILQELRPVLRDHGQTTERIGNPARVFFRPVEQFVVDPGTVRVLAWRIERPSLTQIWDWLCHMLPEPAEEYIEKANAALLADDNAGAERAAGEFQDAAIVAIGDTVERARVDDRFGRRVAAHIRSVRPLEELETLRVVLAHREALAQIAERLPAQVRNLGDDQIQNVLAVLKQGVGGKRDAVAPALVLVFDRLGISWQMVRLAIRSAESDVPAKVAQSPFAYAVDMVLADIRGRIEELRDLCRRGRHGDVLGPLRDAHDAIRALRTEIDLSGDSAWGRELGAIRSAASETLGSELDSTPGMVRRMLRPRSPKDAASARLDPLEVAETEGRLGLVAACRNYAGELAVNQIAQRVYAELQTYIDNGTAALIEGLRTAGPAERAFRQSQVDAAVRFAAKLFGQDYATLLSKAAAVAAVERKPA